MLILACRLLCSIVHKHAAPAAAAGVRILVSAPAGEEDTFEWNEEELEEGPEQLAVLDADTEVDGMPAWTPLFSSSNDQLKNQVRTAAVFSWVLQHCDLKPMQVHWLLQRSRLLGAPLHWKPRHALVTLGRCPVSRIALTRTM